jgi:PAS domain S-box-containing protein
VTLDAPTHFRAAFEQAIVGMVFADLEGRVLRANDAYCRIVGRTAEEVVGKPSRDYTHPADRELNVQHIRRLQAGEIERTTWEKRYIRPDGSVVWALINLSPSRDEGGNVTHLVGVVQDITDHKRTDEELSEARRKLDSALSAGEVATFEWDVDRDRLWGDVNFDRIFGVHLDPDGSAPLARFVEAIHPEDRDRVAATVRRTVDTGVDYETEYRILVDDRIRWVIARGRLEHDEATGAARFPGLLLDITERRKLEERFERQTRIYDTILSTTDDFAYLFDLDGRFLFANRRLLEVWGITLEGAIGKTCYDLGYPEWHADMHMRELAQVKQTKRPIKGEVPYLAPTGIFGVYEYIFTPVFDAHGEVEFIAGTTRDVTARKQAEEDQRRLASQLRLALDAARMGWWQFDVASGIVTCDERVRELYSMREAELPYQDVIACIHDDDRPLVEAAVRAATNPAAPRPYDAEYRVQQPDGTVRWIASRGQASFEGEGEARRAVALVGMALDVTEIRTFAEVNRQLLESERAARAEAEAAGRVKDEFLATLSHELRTPLSAILGWSQILSGGGNSAEELAEGLAVIEQNARAQGQIIEDLLDMSRIISGKVRLDVRPIDVAAVVIAAIETVQPAANAKGVRIEPALIYGVPVTGDANRLQQVFWNLLANAVKFTPHGGRVEVHMERTAADVEVSVTDTGDGISAEFLPYVFDRFRQADASTTRQHGGLGLGLAIVKNLTESHGGSVRVSSAGLGQGASFTVSIPLLAARSALDSVPERRRVERTEPLAAGVCSSLEGVRVLLVDDDAEARRLLTRFLEDCNAVVATASSASEALEAMSGAQYDVLVSDVGMPGEDGHSLVRKVRTRGLALPAVAVSAYARPEDRAMSLDAGFNVHLVKPVDPAALIAAVATVTARAH